MAFATLIFHSFIEDTFVVVGIILYGGGNIHSLFVM